MIGHLREGQPYDGHVLHEARIRGQREGKGQRVSLTIVLRAYGVERMPVDEAERRFTEIADLFFAGRS